MTALIVTTFQKISSIGMYYVFMGPPPPHINVEVLLNIMIDKMVWCKSVGILPLWIRGKGWREIRNLPNIFDGGCSLKWRLMQVYKTLIENCEQIYWDCEAQITSKKCKTVRLGLAWPWGSIHHPSYSRSQGWSSLFLLPLEQTDGPCNELENCYQY